jgi:hypothetical protein
MGFRLPNFNLAVDLWRKPSVPGVDPPDASFMGNLSVGRRTQNVWLPLDSTSVLKRFVVKQISELLVPALTDVQPSDHNAVGPSDAVEVPSGSGRFYIVLTVEDVAKGFSNEYRLLGLIQSDFVTSGLIPGILVPIFPSPIP